MQRGVSHSQCGPLVVNPQEVSLPGLDEFDHSVDVASHLVSGGAHRDAWDVEWVAHGCYGGFDTGFVDAGDLRAVASVDLVPVVRCRVMRGSDLYAGIESPVAHHPWHEWRG